ncbi:helix-turn-helix domain-containing protein [Ascidiimonas sp. W6]|uniref:helix-turn-helix domain-containing protein n=1 Tax=Ascidiimonas meishanensis TaxID=3128903 RepID=UPI0030EC463F
MLASKSPSKTHAQLKLTIHIDYVYIHLVKVSLFDTHNREVIPLEKSNQHHLYFEIPSGLYTLRMVMNGQVKDKVFLLDKDKSFNIANHHGENVIKPPKQFSSVLVSELYESSHEYYTNPAVEWSQKDTFTHGKSIVHKEANSSLFIFLRFPSVEHYNRLREESGFEFFDKFKLTDENGKVLFYLNDENATQMDRNTGWLAVNCKLISGTYFLLYEGEQARQIPVNIFEHWHTQLFLTVGAQPLFGTLRIFLARQRRFDPHNETYKYIDILLNKLQNRDYSLGKELVEMAAYGKFESPMIGLVAAYIYLKSKETHEDNLFKVITENMQQAILKKNEDSPDLRALTILASQHFDDYNFDKTVVKGTPMLRVGFEALLSAAVDNVRLIKENSINDYISENLYFDSPFNTFKPFPFPKDRSKRTKKPSKKIRNPRPGHKGGFGALGSGDFFDKTNEPAFSKEILSDEVFNEWDSKMMEEEAVNYQPKITGTKRFKVSVKDLFDKKLLKFVDKGSEEKVRNSWVKQGIYELVTKDKKITMNEISSQLGVSRNTVSRIFAEWEDEANSN